MMTSSRQHPSHEKKCARTPPHDEPEGATTRTHTSEDGRCTVAVANDAGRDGKRYRNQRLITARTERAHTRGRWFDLIYAGSCVAAYSRRRDSIHAGRLYRGR